MTFYCFGLKFKVKIAQYTTFYSKKFSAIWLISANMQKVLQSQHLGKNKEKLQNRNLAQMNCHPYKILHDAFSIGLYLCIKNFSWPLQLAVHTRKQLFYFFKGSEFFTLWKNALRMRISHRNHLAHLEKIRNFLFVGKLLNKLGEEILLLNPVKNFGKNNVLNISMKFCLR